MKLLGNNPKKNLINVGVIREHVFCNLVAKQSLKEWDASKLRGFPYIRILGVFR